MDPIGETFFISFMFKIPIIEVKLCQPNSIAFGHTVELLENIQTLCRLMRLFFSFRVDQYY